MALLNWVDQRAGRLRLPHQASRFSICSRHSYARLPTAADGPKEATAPFDQRPPGMCSSRCERLLSDRPDHPSARMRAAVVGRPQRFDGGAADVRKRPANAAFRPARMNRRLGGERSFARTRPDDELRRERPFARRFRLGRYRQSFGGNGVVDLVFVPGFVTNLDRIWKTRSGRIFRVLPDSHG